MTRVLVAMSGGVDSAAAAAVLVAAGHDVTGATLKLWCYGGAEASPRSCCSLRDIEDAREAADTLGIPHYVLDEASQFERDVVTPFVASYLNGETPNPCVRCNTHLKFGSLLRRAERLGFDAVATGHYARRQDTPSGPVLCRAVDRTKDQSYVLWGIAREDLSRSLFPLGELTKHEARETARQAGLRLSEKVESQDICFVQGGAYSEFVASRAPESPVSQPGELVDREGRVIGRHRGAMHYTIGQRRGLGMAFGAPAYVLRVDAARNRVVVGSENDLLETACTVREVNWVSCDPPRGPVEAGVKIRYRSRPAPATVMPRDATRAAVRFHEPVRAVSPGQSAVFYQGEVVLGGGIIEAPSVEDGTKSE